MPSSRLLLKPDSFLFDSKESLLFLANTALLEQLHLTDATLFFKLDAGLSFLFEAKFLSLDSKHFTFDSPSDFFLSSAPIFLFTLLALLFFTEAGLFGDSCEACPFLILTLYTQSFLLFTLYARLFLKDAAGFSFVAKTLLCLALDARFDLGYTSSLLLLLALLFCLCLSFCFFFCLPYASLLFSYTALCLFVFLLNSSLLFYTDTFKLSYDSFILLYSNRIYFIIQTDKGGIQV